jgi:hypothetical protein
MRAEADDRDPRIIGGGPSACHTVTAVAPRTTGCERAGIIASAARKVPVPPG